MHHITHFQPHLDVISPQQSRNSTRRSLELDPLPRTVLVSVSIQHYVLNERHGWLVQVLQHLSEFGLDRRELIVRNKLIKYVI
jgi:hypothetical protein